MGKKSTPQTPDYTSLATQQANQQNQLNAQQTWANRANQTNPFGSVSWGTTTTTDPATGKPVTQWTQNTSYDPTITSGMQAQYGAQATGAQTAQQMAGNLGSQLGPVNTSGFTNWGGTPTQTTSGAWGGAGNARQQAEDALYKGATSRLDPQWQNRQSDLTAQLANKGITSGSAAYDRAMDDFNRQRTDAYQQAQYGAATGATQQAQALQGMDLSQQQQAYQQSLGIGGFQDQQRQQQLAEAQGLQSGYLQNYLSLLGGSGINAPSFGSYQSAAGGQAPDLVGAAQQGYQGQLDAYNAKQAQTGQLITAAGQIGMSAAML